MLSRKANRKTSKLSPLVKMVANNMRCTNAFDKKIYTFQEPGYVEICFTIH